MRCGRYLDKAQTLKSSISFQSRMAWDYILDLVQLSQLMPMVVAYDKIHSTETELHQQIYFGYEGYFNRRYTWAFVAHTVEDGSWKGSVITYPSRERYASKGIYKPRTTTMNFLSKEHAEAYLKDMHAMLVKTSDIKEQPEANILIDASYAAMNTEQQFLLQLAENNV